MRARLRFCAGDLLAVALVVLLIVLSAVLTWRQALPEGTGMLQIYQGGALVREAALDTDDTIVITGEYANTIRIEGGRACIAASDCPGEDCVHSGWIDRPGRSIVCLPNGVELRITGAGEVDFTVR